MNSAHLALLVALVMLVVSQNTIEATLSVISIVVSVGLIRLRDRLKV